MYPDSTSRSARLFRRAQEALPGGNSRHTVFYAPYPIYAASGQGCHVVDVDGRSYLDMINNASASIHGHCHPEIVEAIRDQAGRLISVGMPTELEIALAELLCDRLPGVERVRFCNSGSEAVMFALKAARAFTGRPKIAKVEGAYHGAYDVAEASMGSDPDTWGDAKRPAAVASSRGTPITMLADVVVLPFNDVEASLALLEESREELAAVLIDPLIARMAYAPASPDYLRALRRFCDASGAQLLFDEVYSFRMGYRGAQGAVGVTPDLTALGKIIGGGLPIGAVGGSADVMAVFDQVAGAPKAPHGGTFNANPLAMAAGLKAMELLTPEAFADLALLGARTRRCIDEAFAVAGVEGAARGSGSFVSIRLSRQPYDDYRQFMRTAAAQSAFPAIQHGLINRGVVTLGTGNILLSTPMRDTDIDLFAEALLGALRDLSAARRAE